MIFLPILSQKSLKSTLHLPSRSPWNNLMSKDIPSVIASFCLSSQGGGNDDKKNVKLPEEPQNCCMSGCANCVWVTYAEEVAKILNDEGETAKQKIMENVKDPNLRAFLLLELNHLFKKKIK